MGRSVTHKKMLPRGKKSLTQGQNGSCNRSLYVRQPDTIFKILHVRQLSYFLDFELIQTKKKCSCAMFVQITKMLLNTVDYSSKIRDCRTWSILKIFNLPRLQSKNNSFARSTRAFFPLVHFLAVILQNHNVKQPNLRFYKGRQSLKINFHFLP